MAAAAAETTMAPQAGATGAAMLDIAGLNVTYPVYEEESVRAVRDLPTRAKSLPRRGSPPNASDDVDRVVDHPRSSVRAYAARGPERDSHRR